MRGMNSGCIDLIYLDPPFNSNANYAAPVGSKAAGAEFRDTWTLNDIKVEWIGMIEDLHPALHQTLVAAPSDSMKSYLTYMAVRLLEMRRILKSTGSIYLHCDPTASHYLKSVMDAVFGHENFRNEIVWCYNKGGRRSTGWKRCHDTILFYSKGPDAAFSPVRVATSDGEFKMRKGFKKPDGTWWELTKPGKEAGSWWADIPSFGTRTNAKEYLDYPTQKPVALLERIITASSREGDLVLDPFCGCATTMVAADRLNRQWAGVDLSEKAVELVKGRIKDDQGLFKDIVHRTDLPRRDDVGTLPSPKSHKPDLYGEQGGHCAGCGQHFELRNLENDHIVARSSGGLDHKENLQLLCGGCNRLKGDRGMEYLLSSLKMDGIQRETAPS